MFILHYVIREDEEYATVDVPILSLGWFETERNAQREADRLNDSRRFLPYVTIPPVLPFEKWVERIGVWDGKYEVRKVQRARVDKLSMNG